jgi:hypothetical protein
MRSCRSRFTALPKMELPHTGRWSIVQIKAIALIAEAGPTLRLPDCPFRTASIRG